MNIVGSRQYADTDWQIVRSVTKVSTLHALYKPSAPPVAFGVEGKLDDEMVGRMISFLGELAPEARIDGSFRPAPNRLGAFDGFSFVSGKDRRFLCGWTGAEAEITHAFPVYRCELDGQDRLPPFARFSRCVNVFDLGRPPEPYFTFRMMGGASRLRVKTWSTERYSTLKSFVGVLSGEEQARLEVVNHRGTLLSFSSASEWSGALEKLHRHLVEDR